MADAIVIGWIIGHHNVRCFRNTFILFAHAIDLKDPQILLR